MNNQKKVISKIRQQSIKDKTTINYLGRATSLIRRIQMDITDVIKKDHVKVILKRKKNRTATDNDSNEDNDHKIDIISREQLRRFQKENKIGQVRFKRLETVVDRQRINTIFSLRSLLQHVAGLTYFVYYELYRQTEIFYLYRKRN